MFVVASAAIGLFYGAGLMWGRQTHLAMAEYWRWWVMHLWVEGFFEVFATVVIAFLFTRMGLLQIGSATTAVIFSTVIFLGGGILGTMHHLYFTRHAHRGAGAGRDVQRAGNRAAGADRLRGLREPHAEPGAPVGVGLSLADLFFVAVAFWNLVGAGLFGFLINPPIALYYMQGLNTTPVHGHTALFGVYGMLGIGLMLFCLRGLTRQEAWKSGALSFSFWSMNVGLALMVLLSLLPVGLLQTWASVEHGMWYARSAEFLQTPLHGQAALAARHRRHHLRPRRGRLRLVRARPQDRLVLCREEGRGRGRGGRARS